MFSDLKFQDLDVSIGRGGDNHWYFGRECDQYDHYQIYLPQQSDHFQIDFGSGPAHTHTHNTAHILLASHNQTHDSKCQISQTDVEGQLGPLLAAHFWP